MVIGAGLASYFFIPVIFERSYIQIKYITQFNYYNFRNNYLYVIDNIRNVNDYRFYLELNLLVIIETLLFIAIIKVYIKYLLTVSGIIFLLALYLTLPVSSLIWSYVPGFATLQFPWRWVLVMELSLCFLCCMVFAGKMRIGSLLTSPDRIIVYCIVVLAALSTSKIFLFEALTENDLEDVTDQSKVVQYKKLPKEYTPVWVPDLATMLHSAPVDKVTVLSGVASTSILDWKSEHRIIALKAYTPALLDIATFYYPGWKAEIDGKEVTVGIRKTSGTILVAVPKGEHRVEMKFTDTPLRVYGKYVTLASSVLLLLFILASAWRPAESVGSGKENELCNSQP
jgi:hypothetical protein